MIKTKEIMLNTSNPILRLPKKFLNAFSQYTKVAVSVYKVSDNTLQIKIIKSRSEKDD